MKRRFVRVFNQDSGMLGDFYCVEHPRWSTDLDFMHFLKWSCKFSYTLTWRHFKSENTILQQ